VSQSGSQVKLPVIFFIFFFISPSCYSQDSTFYNSDRLEVFSLENATEYKVVTFLDEKGINAVERMYFKSGQMKSETFYSSFEKGKRTGKRSNWKESGNLYLESHFKNDKMEGPFIVYWENGREKRKDIYKKGKLVKGVVWDTEGNEMEYFPYEQPAEFPGGKKMMEKFLKENSKFPETSNKKRLQEGLKLNFL